VQRQQRAAIAHVGRAGAVGKVARQLAVAQVQRVQAFVAAVHAQAAGVQAQVGGLQVGVVAASAAHAQRAAQHQMRAFVVQAGEVTELLGVFADRAKPASTVPVMPLG
jgi:hypothetical protein